MSARPPSRLLGEERGQMCVELAALLPVVIVVALAVFNLARFVELCARFDRVALDAVTSQGVSPAGSQDVSNAVASVRSSIEAAFDGVDGVEVIVSQAGVGRLAGEDVTFSLVPTLTRFTCELRFRPWPSAFSIAGVSLRPPAFLVHTKSLVVDRFRPGVVV